MRIKVAFVALALVMAVWTGQSRYGTSVTGQPVVECQYQAAGQYFWRTLSGWTCPLTIEVE